jgi:mono/diheme cytochrome c family protein
MKKILLLSSLLLAACSEQASDKDSAQVNVTAEPATQVSAQVSASDSKSAEPALVERWYNPQQVQEGKQLFAASCAVCHGNEAQGLAENWKKPDENGNYPPPPLDGSAHAWHHPLVALKHTINEGGAPVGGVMPAFKHVYTDAQIDSLLASIQSRWSDKIYQNWDKRNQ